MAFINNNLHADRDAIQQYGYNVIVQEVKSQVAGAKLQEVIFLRVLDTLLQSYHRQSSVLSTQNTTKADAIKALKDSNLRPLQKQFNEFLYRFDVPQLLTAHMPADYRKIFGTTTGGDQDDPPLSEAFAGLHLSIRDFLLQAGFHWFWRHYVVEVKQEDGSSHRLVQSSFNFERDKFFIPQFFQTMGLTSLEIHFQPSIGLDATIGQLTSLKKLSIHPPSCSTRVISIALPEAWSQLVNLESLSFSQCHHENWGVFSGASALTTLKMHASFGYDFPWETFLHPMIGQLTSLTDLTVAGAESAAIPFPKETSQLVNLKTLVFSDCLPENWGVFSGASKLTKLSIQIEPNPNLSWVRGTMEFLQHHNQITKLSLVGMLEDLADTYPVQKLTILQPVFQLSGLTSLCLVANKLGRIPDDLSALENLEYLDLSGNSLTGLPDSFTQLTNLTTLEIWDNALTAEGLPGNFLSHQVKLKELAIDADLLKPRSDHQVIVSDDVIMRLSKFDVFGGNYDEANWRFERAVAQDREKYSIENFLKNRGDPDFFAYSDPYGG